MLNTAAMRRAMRTAATRLTWLAVSWLGGAAPLLLLACGAATEPEAAPPTPIDPAPDATQTSPSVARVPLQHRAESVACDNERPPGNLLPNGVEPQGQCSSDEQCTDGVRGRCQDLRGFTSCTYDECVSDSECNTGGPCDCEQGSWSDGNTCLDGNCQIDADCGSTGYCSPTLGTCGAYTGVVGYWCHTPEDTCVDDADCTGEGPGYCMFSPDVGHWVCSYAHCVG